MSYDRVLPIPAALHHESAQVALPPRQTSNLLEHKIMNDNYSHKVTMLDRPLHSLPPPPPHHYQYFSPPPSHGDEYANSLPQIHLSSINRAKVAYNHMASSGPLEPYKSIAPLPSAKEIPIRERSSFSDRSGSSSPGKSSSSREQQPPQQQQQSVAQFCLCQPDPKIPRPRNGE